MQIIIMRHGEAVAGADNDAARCLTPRGEQQALATGRQLAPLLGNAALRCFASPYLRAQQTARLVTSTWSLAAFDTLDHLTPDTPPDWALAAVDKVLGDDQPEGVVLVAHMPLVAALTGLLTAEPVYSLPGFATACAAVLETEVLASGCATLQQFIQPGL